MRAARSFRPRPGMAATLTLLLLAWHYYGHSQSQYLLLNILPELQDMRTTFTQIRSLKPQGDTSGIGLGIGAIFSFFGEPRDTCGKHIRQFLAMAEEFDIPVLVQLDGEQWWQARPDLWNWWDSTRPGYNPANAYNVEWCGWGAGNALKIAWRNWGKQIRVLPPPNLMSARYRSACHDEMIALVPEVLNWWKSLPPSRKHLFFGMKLGWESSIGVNAFYYPDGNRLLGHADSSDPHIEVKGESVPDRGFETIGYAAVSTAGIADSGSIKEEYLARVAYMHMEDLCALASELGVPREKLFTHGAGWKDEEVLYDAAVNRYSCPGWSFYRYAYNPFLDKGARRAWNKSTAPWWAAVEWMLLDSTSTDSWVTGITNTLSDHACRYMCVYNWEGIMNTPGAVEAIRRVLNRNRPGR
jgi:hypothetical protein